MADALVFILLNAASMCIGMLMGLELSKRNLESIVSKMLDDEIKKRFGNDR